MEYGLMADYGAIAGIGLGAGFLNGFADAYARGNAQKAEMQAEQVKRAAYQQDMMLRYVLETVSKNPGMTTNAGFRNAIQGMGLNPEITQGVSVLSDMIASDPGVQQAETQREQVATMRSRFTAPSSAGEVGGQLQQLGVPSVGPRGSVPPQSVMDLANQPGGAEALRTATDPRLTFERRIKESPISAAAAFPTLVPVISAQQRAAGTGSKNQQPKIQVHTYPVGNEMVTEETTTHPDGTVTKEILGKGKAGKNQRQSRMVAPKERTDIGMANALLEVLDQLEAQAADPELRSILGGQSLVQRGVGALAEKVIKGGAQAVESSTRTAKQEEFASLVSRQMNVDLHNLYGAALTLGERARGDRMVPDITLKPDAFVGRIRSSRVWVLKALENKIQALVDSKATGIPLIREPANVRSARRVRLLNKRIGRYADDGTSDAPAEAPGGSSDTPAQDRLQRFQETGKY